MADSEPLLPAGALPNAIRKKAEEKSFVGAVLFGCLNAMILVPVEIAFASIIFRDSFFAPEMPRLINLVMFSSMMHQIMFNTFSSMNFAVGQVQDAGLIFLSAMSSSIVAIGLQNGDSGARILSTTMVCLSLSTAMLGVSVMSIGAAKLASFVQYLPMPVVGGYLAFIGLYCGQAGLAMMAGVTVEGYKDWGMLCTWHALVMMAPGIFLGLGLRELTMRVPHMLTLPLAMGSIMAGFYLVLFATGTSLEEARGEGWVAPLPEATTAFYESWEIIDFGNVAWGSLVPQIPHWIGMVFVVSFSSSLDVAAIEMELGEPLDYNGELKMVGLSNVVSGLTGGYTGSYIFSQTIFNIRSGRANRWTGWTIALFELFVFLSPVSVTSFVPKCFFGGLLVMIMIDLCLEWLWHARHKMALSEFFVGVGTFLCIVFFGINLGLFGGFVLEICVFAVVYAATTSEVRPKHLRSTVMRTFAERLLLKRRQRAMITLPLDGYIFFGSAVRILAQVRELLHDEDARLADAGELPKLERDVNDQSTPRRRGSSEDARENKSQAFSLVSHRGGPANLTLSARGGGGGGGGGSPWGAGRGLVRHKSETDLDAPGVDDSKPGGGAFQSLTRRFTEKTPLLGGGGGRSGGGFGSTFAHSPLRETSRDGSARQDSVDSDDTGRSASVDDGTPARSTHEAVSSYMEAWAEPPTTAETELAFELIAPLSPRGPARSTSPAAVSSRKGASEPSSKREPSARLRFLILDLTGVYGIDASAARSCLLFIRRLLEARGAMIIFAAPPAQVKELLIAHEVIAEEGEVFATLDEALEWAEEHVISESRGSLDSRVSRPYYLAASHSRRTAALAHLTGSPMDVSRGGDRRPGGIGGRKGTAQLAAILEDYLFASSDRGLDRERKHISRLLSDEVLSVYFKRAALGVGELLYDAGAVADAIHFIESGTVDILGEAESRIQRISDGGVCGELGFFLKQPLTVRAQAATDVVAWRLDRKAMAKMQSQDSDLCVLVQGVLLKSLTLQASLLTEDKGKEETKTKF